MSVGKLSLKLNVYIQTPNIVPYITIQVNSLGKKKRELSSLF